MAYLEGFTATHGCIWQTGPGLSGWTAATPTSCSRDYTMMPMAVFVIGTAIITGMAKYKTCVFQGANGTEIFRKESFHIRMERICHNASIVGTDKALEDNVQAESPGKNEASSNGKEPQGAGSRISDAKSAIPVYRVFNPRTGEHFYTESEYERNILVQRGWNGEGIGWYAPQKSSTPVYRLNNPNSGEHHYTCSRIEKNWLVILGWRYEGIGWYSDDNKEVAIYRHYHPIQRTGNHHFTMSKGESRHIVNYEGWRYEGVGWYGVLTD